MYICNINPPYLKNNPTTPQPQNLTTSNSSAMNRIKYIVLIFSLLAAFDLGASKANGRVDVKKYSNSTRQSMYRIQNMVQDDDGYVWIATWNGLEKFDGYGFHKFKSYPTDESRLPYNRIQNVYLAFKNALWCETYDHRLYIFDTAKEKFFDPFSFHPNLQKCNEIESLFRLDDGVGWISDGNGNLWRINGADYAKENGIEHFSNIFPKGKFQINGIFSDGSGGEWILSDKGYLVYGKKGLSGMRQFVNATKAGNKLLLIDDKGALVVYDPSSGLNDVKLNGTLIDKNSDIAAIDDDTFILSSKTGVLTYNIKTGEKTTIPIEGLQAYDYSKFHPTKSKAQNGDIWMLTNKDVFRIELGKKKVKKMEIPVNVSDQFLFFANEDNRGELWIASINGPLFHYNRHKDILEPAYFYQDNRKATTPNIRLAYLIDNQNNIWARDEQGFNKITFPTGQSDFLDYSEYESRSLLLDHKGRIWNGTRRNDISIYDKDNNLVGYFNPRSGTIEKSPSAQFPSAVYSMLQDTKGRIWFGTREDGIILATPTVDDHYSMRQFSQNKDNISGINSNSIYSIFEDKKGRIWIGTYGGGINLVDESAGEIKFLNNNNGGLPYSFDNAKCKKVRHITETSDGIIMAGTTDGLITFSSDFNDPQKIKYYRNWCDVTKNATLSSNDVFFTFEDSKHQIYVIVHGGGICKLNGTDLLSDDLSFSYIGAREGLPTDMVYAMGEDKTGKLWISLENAICSYTRPTKKIETYDKNTFHLPLTLSEAPFLFSEDDIAYFPTLNGTLQIDLNNLHKSTFKPNIVFEHATIPSDNDSTKVVRITDGVLNLKKDERNFSISFIAFDYDNTENISYAYRMDGDDKWLEIGHKHEPTFYGLPGGDHILEVRSTNGEGVWMDNVASLKIHIEPTFKETIWIWILSFILIIAVGLAIWFIITWIHRLRRQVSVEQELTKLKLRFFTDVSHELRTPLTLIVNPIDEVMADPTLSEKGKEYISIAKHNTDRMLKLINQLLDIRKIQNNKMHVYIEYTDIVPLFRRIYEDFTSIARQKNIDFSLKMSMDAFNMYTDIDKLEKIAFNLLSNAFKYTPDGGKIELEVKNEGENLTIAISDTGAGIDKKQLKNIFNRFETIGRKTGVNSSGIGLSLVQELVGILHGSLDVDSTPGEGSRFEVKLPGNISALQGNPNVEFILTDGNREEAGEVARDKEEIETAGNEGEKPTIMVVEDNGELRQLLYRMLSDRYNVKTAADGQEAWEKLHEDMPDIIISDIMMPRMDGLELLAKVRETPECSHIPFIVLSAKASLADRIEGIECGADDYITKPFSASYLRSRVRSLLNQRLRLSKYLIDPDSRPMPEQEQSETEEKLLPALTRFDEKFIADLRNIIMEKIGNSELTIDDLADALKMGRTAFNKKVKSLFSMSPIELLKNMRIRHAMDLLKDSDKTVSEISYICGFSSPQYFNRVFKSATDLTPNDWRKQNLE